MGNVGSSSLKRVLTLMAVLSMAATACVEIPPGLSQGADCGPPPVLHSGADLVGCVLAGFDFSGLNLDGADFSGANLVGADFENASLVGANFEGANVSEANFTGADLTNAIFAGAVLFGTLFILANLTGVSFDFGRVFGPNGAGGSSTPTGPDCKGPLCAGTNDASVFTGDYICDPDLDQIMGEGFFVTRTEEQLKEADMRSTLTDARTRFDGAIFDNTNDELALRGLNLRQASFKDASFTNQIFACQDLDGANFENVSFTEQEFHHISARGANFSGADVFTAWFCDSDFSAATFADSQWGGFVGFSCADFLPGDEFDLLPDPLNLFNGANFSGSVMRSEPDPERGALFAMTYIYQGNTRSASFIGANFDNTRVTDGLFHDANFTDSTANGAVFIGTTYFNGVTFSPGWANATVDGTAYFDGATCPSGSVAGPTDTCF